MVIILIVHYILSCSKLKSGGAGRSVLLRHYRRFKLLSRLHKNAWKDPVMPFVIGVITVIESTSLYVLIASHHELTLAVLGLFSIVAIDCLIVIHCFFKIMSYPYTRSVELVQIARRGIKNCSRWEVRFVKSWHPLTVEMGNNTFFDRMTSLTIWKMSTDILITFLLM